MKSILMLIKNLKNLIPYFLLIATYFFFVNLEARKDQNKNRNEINLVDNNSISEDKQLKIKIPVIQL